MTAQNLVEFIFDGNTYRLLYSNNQTDGSQTWQRTYRIEVAGADGMGARRWTTAGVFHALDCAKGYPNGATYRWELTPGLILALLDLLRNELELE